MKMVNSRPLLGQKIISRNIPKIIDMTGNMTGYQGYILNLFNKIQEKDKCDEINGRYKNT